MQQWIKNGLWWVAIFGGVLGGKATAATLSGTGMLTTDYVWRGSSQTRGDPAVQGSVKLAADSGWYASIWGSNVEFDSSSANSEWDITTGWSGNINEDWAIDLNSIYYRYPSTSTNLNWIEFGGTLTWKQNYWLSAWWSDDAMATDEQGTYFQLGMKQPLWDKWRFEGVLGHYMLDQSYGDSYTHMQFSMIRTLTSALELRGTFHTTDASARNLFTEQAGERFELALQFSF